MDPTADTVETGTASFEASHLGPPQAIEADHSRDDVEATTYHTAAGTVYQSVADDQLLPPPNFRPFFTLIEDAITGEHHHPAVHYFFSDDDTEGLTSSVLDSLQTADPDPNHRLLLVDFAADGRTVTSSHSLNSVWQISETSVVPAPSWTTESGPETATEGLMLRIQGREAPKSSEKEKRRSATEDVIARMENDVELYNDRLGHLQSVLAKAALPA